MQRLHFVCTVEGCDRPHKSRGYCNTHYAQHFRQKPIIPNIKTRDHHPPECCVEAGCSDPVKAKGLCKMHYARLLRHGHTRYRDRKKPPKICRISGCENWLYSKGLCHAHYIKTRVWKAFGLDADGYTEMFKRQRGVCAICGEPESATNGPSTKTRDLAVDHCHKTGKVRELLCSQCNLSLGGFKDDPNLLLKAIAYVLRHTD